MEFSSRVVFGEKFQGRVVDVGCAGGWIEDYVVLGFGF